ncbi:hypothetical protein AB0E59_17555 [Lentzea sp. NPDC034063]|uniref:hypothetical protein n=1 Tax=unclassified Lentzea TaxID=2643253 RepID=UPI0033F799C2
MTPEHQSLISALVGFIADAKRSAVDHPELADRATANHLAELPASIAVREAANAAARANDYLDEDQHAGRMFDGSALYQLGVAALLRSSQEIDAQALAEQLAAYLAGPPEQVWRYFVLNLDWDLPRPVDLDNWQLSRPDADTWKRLRPVSLAADFAPTPTWDPLLEFGEHVVVAVPDTEPPLLRGHWVLWFSRGPSRDLAWEPLLAFNLWSNDPVEVVAEHVVEPGRRVDKRHSSVPSNYIGPDAEYEVPLLGPLRIDDKRSEQLIRFLTEITSRLHQPKLDPKFRKRIQRCAIRYLSTGDKVGYDSDVTFPDDEPQVVLNYVTALENLLSGESESHGDLTRKAAQRAAVLIGKDDEDRLAILHHVEDAYKVRSKIAHGDEPNQDKLAKSATTMRPIIRRALIAAIVLNDPMLATVCDEALLSRHILQEKILDPLAKFQSLLRSS